MAQLWQNFVGMGTPRAAERNTGVSPKCVVNGHFSFTVTRAAADCLRRKSLKPEHLVLEHIRQQQNPRTLLFQISCKVHPRHVCNSPNSGSSSALEAETFMGKTW